MSRELEQLRRMLGFAALSPSPEPAAQPLLPINDQDSRAGSPQQNDLDEEMAANPPPQVSPLPSRSPSPQAPVRGGRAGRGRGGRARQPIPRANRAILDGVYRPRGMRMKVYGDGYFMSFDKKSSCGTTNFWRCERKNTCPARIHTRADGLLIVKRLHEHNHPAPSSSELGFYSVNLEEVVPDHVLPVNTVSNLFMQRPRRPRQEMEGQEQGRESPFEELHRRMRELEEREMEMELDEPMAARSPVPAPAMLQDLRMYNQLNMANSPRIAHEAAGSEMVARAREHLLNLFLTPEAQNNPVLLANLRRFVHEVFPGVENPNQPSPSTSAATGGPSLSPATGAPSPFAANGYSRASSIERRDGEQMRQPRLYDDPRFLEASRLFGEVYEDICERQERNAPSSSAASSSSSNSTPGTSNELIFYLAMFDEDNQDDEEISYRRYAIQQRTVAELRRVLQNFAQLVCNGNIVEAHSARINLIICDDALRLWQNERVFLLDTRTRKSGWKLIPQNRD